MSICRTVVLSRRVVEVSSLIVYQLLQQSRRLCPRSNLIYLNTLYYYISSVLAREVAISLASIVNFVTHRYSIAFQLISPLNRKNMQPYKLLRIALLLVKEVSITLQKLGFRLLAIQIDLLEIDALQCRDRSFIPSKQAII